MKSFGTFLKYIRKQRNLTQEQVAERLNIVTPILSKWENDKAVPPLDMLCRLCNVLDVSIEECIAAEIFEGERILPPENYDPERLGETIKNLRTKNGWSQAEVGKKMFVTSQTVSKWESGGISSLEILGKLAELFGLTPTELLNGLERIRSIPKKKTTAEQLKKSNRFILKITAVVLALVIFLGAVAGLIVGLIIKNKDDGEQNKEDNTQTEQPDDGEQKQPEAVSFVTPIKEFYSVSPYGQINGQYILGGMFFEVAADTPVYAIADGTIISVNLVGVIKIEHSEGFVSVYSYIEGSYEVGEKVQKGQQLSTVSFEFFYLNLYLNGEEVDPFEYITELPEPIERPPEHVHEWGEWQNDETYHWQECECGESSEKGKHTLVDGKCSVCGYESNINTTVFGLPMQTEIYRGCLEEVEDADGGSSDHIAVDFSAKAGDKVYAVADGEIERILDYLDYSIIRIKHSNGVVSVYSGVIPVDSLSVGDEVKKGELIALISEIPIESEADDNPHLHFVMMVKSIRVNPLDYIPYKEKQT